MIVENQSEINLSIKTKNYADFLNVDPVNLSQQINLLHRRDLALQQVVSHLGRRGESICLASELLGAIQHR